ncbi:SulP family inorganic anion transporter [Aurantibacter sp.]|uniref:SulP family inorganic anion transporter n=1 Tax=Aurantibacter sp. TaxID=2807103 RepID=UPI0035C83179
MSPKSNIVIFFKSLPKNIFSGFVVSLIALPLGLGLAMASDAPPIAGIIAAVVGGIIVSILGGSNVTITGPGNGLVGVLLVAISTLGLESAYAAIICSGALLLILGFLRMGKLADFFPNSAIQGMLAAIGLIILGKQFHIMVAHKIKRDTTVDYLLEIPNAIINVFHFENRSLLYAALAGVLSLLIMIFYSKIRNKYFQLVPAPMWIVMLSIGLSYYFELVLKLPNPIAEEYMISGIPTADQIISELPSIDFSKINSLTFWLSVVSLTLIASIESLLSIKAVDKLDVDKRRSNVNKDLKALGLATVASGLLGGLNVVTVIARSSVNVNNGGSNRSSNFFHAFFLVLFIVLFSTQLTRIPLPALMAILVYTGYKLANPNQLGKILRIGKGQLVIFFVTLFTTLLIGLIQGILAGIIATFILHTLVNKSFNLFAKNILKPNVLMYQEHDNNDSYFISVKHFCSFLNFYKLKERINAIPEHLDVIVDFSMCEFVDDTVMENLSNYQDTFHKKGGHFEIIGLDMHDSKTEHPFALKRMLPVPNIIKKSLTRRQNSLEAFAEDFELNYISKKNKSLDFLEPFEYFKTKKTRFSHNHLLDEKCGAKIFDLEYSEGEFIAKETIRSTMFYLDLYKNIPEFTLDKEGFLEKAYAFAGYTDINVDKHPDFSKRFYLLGKNSQQIKQFFSNELVHFFESNPYYHVESNGKSLLIFSKERVASLKEIKALLYFGKQLRDLILDSVIESEKEPFLR